MLVHPSANHPRRGMGDIGADILFLGIGDLGMQTPRYIEAYWEAVVRASGARLVIPIHWDDFFHPIPPPAWVGEHHGLPEAMGRSQFPYAMRELERHAGDACVQIRFLDAFEEELVDDLRAANRAFVRECEENKARARSIRQ